MTIGNHNNELNARAHRNAIAQDMNALRVVGDEMQAMLDLTEWEPLHESRYDELNDERAKIIARLKLSGMFL